jgi:hypothetical protein
MKGGDISRRRTKLLLEGFASATKVLAKISGNNVKTGFVALMILVAFFRAWIGRFSMDPDGVGYLDVADRYVHQDWSHAINAYWSPLYSWLLAAGMLLLRPGGRTEFAFAHAINCGIFLGTLGCFEYFWRSLRREVFDSARQSEDTQGNNPLPELALWSLAHAVFLWSTLDLITIHVVGADLCTAAFVYLIGGLLLRIRRSPTWPQLLSLGAALGFSYFAKAVMFPLGFCFIAIGFFSLRDRRGAIPRMVVVTLVFLVLTAPFILAISREKGRLTFGDAGKLAYSEYVSPGVTSVRNWQGTPPGSGTPMHPTRKISDHPPAFEFATPVAGTYPPYYDASYWNEGRVASFDIEAQLVRLKVDFLICAELFFHSQSGLLAGALILLLLGGSMSVPALLRNWPLFAMCFAGMGIYMLVSVEPRYVAAYVTVFWVTLLASIRLPQRPDVIRAARYVSMAAFVTVCLSVVDTTARAVRDGGPYSVYNDIVIAESLHNLGLRERDRVATVGDLSYWAKAGGLKVVAEVMSSDAPEFWRTPEEGRQRLYESFA